MARDDGSAGVILAFLAGAATGAAVALLMAPTSGEETRRVLSDRAREGRERAEEAARQGREFLNRQRDNLNSAVERGREAYNQARGVTPPPAPGTPDTL
jgi:gas vesicle protein